MKYQLLFFTILTTIEFVRSAKILGVFPYCSHSHFVLGFSIMKELSSRGHSVTFISCYPQKVPIENLRDISVKDDISGPLQALHIRMNISTFSQMSYWTKLEAGLDFGMTTTEATLKSKSVQELINSREKFDLVVLEHFANEALMILPHIFNSHLILVAPGPATFFTNYLMANPAPSSYVPSFLSGFSSKMGIWQRICNAYFELAGNIFISTRMLPEQNALLKRVLPDTPDLGTLLYNASMMLVSSHSISDPIPLQQNIKDIGGYHLSAPRPLPMEIKKFMDNATEGVIVFSLGSHIKSDRWFSAERLRAILNVFSKIKQKVIWKFESDLEEKPENVMLLKWLPQQDVLGHQNTVAFITHGGLLGITEAIYHGVPILGLPIVWDQHKNAEEAVHTGMGLKIDFLDLNDKNFDNALNELLNNPKYREHARMRSKIMRDHPMKRLDEAIFWIEYVIRHHGAPHMRSSAIDLSWYQLYLIDILFLLILLSSLIVLIVYTFIRRMRIRTGEIVKNKTKVN
ncbi:UDP-glycosyltransferase UGT5 [Leptinotarsa decemlineata]|uniref:UDP-glycosyltransferase UGT5 n=1 Tax=Leptinotarsa decemlineata TaxID=7539 RepID=UPI003D3044E7